MDLPKNLEKVVLRQFDELVEKGSIFYEPTQPESVQHEGFQFEFRIVPYFDQKPIAAPDSPSRTRPGGPFIKPKPEEIIANLGSHRLMVNKYCIYRPMLVLPTTEYALQTDDLDLGDITVSWTVLKAFESPQMVIFNCGSAAGSSVGHKHLQIFPVPSEKSIVLFPSLATSADAIVQDIPNVPFKHFVHKIPKGAKAFKVFELCQALLNQTKLALQEVDATDYNVAFTANWIVLIPRRTAVHYGGPFGANAAGMLGMITIPDEEQRQQWADLGYTDYLVKLGIPIGGSP